ncbi:MAG: hypothetical protein M3Q32_12475 [Pseudomonadota bacterium]|nr:hypothetical protein [Burkholderiales bacterium]MDQ3197141.1 hypothetical protein [Pseudomonadota bacterium]
MEEKLNLLQTRFKVVPGNPEHTEFIVSIQKARNCLVHRFGIVDKDRDCSADGSMHVMWRANHAFGLLGESGKRIEFSEKISLPEPGRIAIELVKRDAVFQPRQTLYFSMPDLREICFFICFARQEL